MAKPPVKRTLKDLFAPRDATDTSRQGQGIGDIEAMRQMLAVPAGAARKVVQDAGTQQREAFGRMLSGAATQDDMTDMASDFMLPMAGSVENVAAKAAKPATDAVKNALIQAYHGSKSLVPFEKFSRDFYGKGAAGDKMGRAVYSTDRFGETVDYLKFLLKGAPSEIVTQKGAVVPVPIQMASDLKAGNSSVGELSDRVSKYLDYLRSKPAGRSQFTESKRLNSIGDQRELLSNLQQILGEGVGEIRRPGTIYELGLDVDPAKLLNFDKELIDQTPFVQDAVKSAINVKSSSSPRDVIKYHDLLNRGIRTPEISQRLEDAGIHGVRGSSTMSPNTKNYAIFNPDRVGISRVMGILGMLTGAGAAGKASQAPNTDKPRRF